MKEEETKRKFEDFVEELKKEDFETLMNRALRLQQLSSSKISLVPVMRIYDYAEEAKICYINRCFRSCIICSSNAVEQIFRHLLITESTDLERTYWEIEIKKMTFGTLLQEVRRRKLRFCTISSVTQSGLMTLETESVHIRFMLVTIFTLKSIINSFGRMR